MTIPAIVFRHYIAIAFFRNAPLYSVSYTHLRGSLQETSLLQVDQALEIMSLFPLKRKELRNRQVTPQTGPLKDLQHPAIFSDTV